MEDTSYQCAMLICISRKQKKLKINRSINYILINSAMVTGAHKNVHGRPTTLFYNNDKYPRKRLDHKRKNNLFQTIYFVTHTWALSTCFKVHLRTNRISIVHIQNEWIY